MDIKNANKVAELVNKINKCDTFLKSLENRSYPDEFEIHYRGGKTCDLEESALNVLIEFYKKQKSEAEKELKSL